MWEPLLRQPPASLGLRYRTGIRRQGGETHLYVRGDGAVEVRFDDAMRHDTYAGQLSRDDVVLLFKMLEKTGFPEVPSHTVPPGSGLCALEVTGGPEHEPVLLHRLVVRDLPAWGRLFGMLDALCHEVSGGKVTPGAAVVVG
jgi:hypothetical protein